MTRGGAKRILNEASHQRLLQKRRVDHIHIDVRGFSQHTATLEQKAKLPGRPALLALGLVDNDRI